MKKLTFENEYKKRDEITPATNNVNTSITKTSLHRYQICNGLTVNPEYSSLVHPLSDLEYETLKNSIKEDGLYYPIIVNPKVEILDGHHRYQICKELGIIPQLKHEVKYFKDSIEEKKFVIDINLKRRQLNNFQKAELAYKLAEIESERARFRQLSKLKDVKENLPFPSIEVNGEKGETADLVSKKTGISRGTYERAKIIIEEGSEIVKEKLRNNKTTISKEYQNIQKDRKRQELLSQLSNICNNNKDNTNECKLFCNDFTKINSETIFDNSIDLIFTDPPYGYDALPLYKDLAIFANRVLKPGGSLVFFVGHIIMDKVINIFNEFSSSVDYTKTGLKFWWPIAVKHSGNHTKIHPRHVFAEWKPMLWYVKGEKGPNDMAVSNTMSDFIESIPPTKILHEWEQSTVEAEYVIKNLTIQNQTILDPMMGTGTTGLATLDLRRKFIGIEKNSETFEIATIRIHKQEFERIKEVEN